MPDVFESQRKRLRIGDIVGELCARAPVKRPASAVNNQLISFRPFLEPFKIAEVEFRDPLPQTLLERERHALPGPEITRVAFCRSILSEFSRLNFEFHGEGIIIPECKDYGAVL